MIELCAGAEEGLRLDAWLSARYPGVSKAFLRQFLRSGGVRDAQGRLIAKGDLVRPGASYFLESEPRPEALRPNPDLPLKVLWQDEALLALSKPAGMDCQPNQSDERETLANALLARFPEAAGVGDGPLTCGILHRIDRETSGLVLVARSQTAYGALRAQFAAHTVVKRYTALVSGDVVTGGRLEHDLAHNPRCPGRMVDAARWRDVRRPMHAVTEYAPLRRLSRGVRRYTLLEATILTGVTHQIRAQLSLAGFPIVGDARYGGEPVEGFPRHFLHATSATFVHPERGEPLTLCARLTADLIAFLRRFKGGDFLG